MLRCINNVAYTATEGTIPAKSPDSSTGAIITSAGRFSHDGGDGG